MTTAGEQKRRPRSDRKTARSTAYLMPTHLIWPAFLFPCVMIVAPGLLQILVNDPEGLWDQKLWVLGSILGVYLGLHAIAIPLHYWNRQRWRVLEELERQAEYVLAYPFPPVSSFVDFRNDRYGLRRFRKSLQDAGPELGPGMIVTSLGIAIFYFAPLSIEYFQKAMLIWALLFFLYSFALYVPACPGRLVVTEFGLMSMRDIYVEFMPWQVIKKVSWKETRYDGKQIVIELEKGNYLLFTSKSVWCDFLTDQERDVLLDILRKYTTVETRWLQKKVEEVVVKEGAGGGQ